MDSESFKKETLCKDILNVKNGVILDNEVFSLSSDESDVSIIEENSMLSNKEVFSLTSSDENEDVKFLRESSPTSNNMNRRKNNKFMMISSESEFSENNFADDINLNIQSDASDGNVSDVNTGVTVRWNKVSSPTGWTKTMRKFYNRPSKRQRYFDWRKILLEIRTGPPSKWHILKADLYPNFSRRKRCLICRQTDHLSMNCPRREGICIMCGKPGHMFFNCPQRMCLNCGVRSNDFTDRCGKCCYEESRKCKNCGRYGHDGKNCPDLWRRFHCTVADKEINSSQVELNKNIQCCNCAKPGHMYEQCTERFWSNYSPTSFIVTSYKDIGSDKQFSTRLEFKTNGATSSQSDFRSYLKRTRQNIEGASDEEQPFAGKKRKFSRQNVRPDQNARPKKPRSFLAPFNLSNSLGGYFNEMIKKRKQKRKKKKKKNKSSTSTE